jgi:hypothetical protein
MKYEDRREREKRSFTMLLPSQYCKTFTSVSLSKQHTVSESEQLQVRINLMDY